MYPGTPEGIFQYWEKMEEVSLVCCGSRLMQFDVYIIIHHRVSIGIQRWGFGEHLSSYFTTLISPEESYFTLGEGWRPLSIPLARLVK